MNLDRLAFLNTDVQTAGAEELRTLRIRATAANSVLEQEIRHLQSLVTAAKNLNAISDEVLLGTWSTERLERLESCCRAVRECGTHTSWLTDLSAESATEAIDARRVQIDNVDAFIDRIDRRASDFINDTKVRTESDR